VFAIPRTRLRFTDIYISVDVPYVIRDIADKRINTNSVELTYNVLLSPLHLRARVLQV